MRRSVQAPLVRGLEAFRAIRDGAAEHLPNALAAAVCRDIDTRQGVALRPQSIRARSGIGTVRNGKDCIASPNRCGWSPCHGTFYILSAWRFTLSASFDNYSPRIALSLSGGARNGSQRLPHRSDRGQIAQALRKNREIHHKRNPLFRTAPWMSPAAARNCHSCCNRPPWTCCARFAPTRATIWPFPDRRPCGHCQWRAASRCWNNASCG